MSLQNLQQALTAKGLQIVDVVQSSPQQVRICGRMKGSVDNWLNLVHGFVFCPETAWTSDVSLWFVPQKRTGKAVFFWRLLFQCSTGDITEHCPAIIRVIASAPKSNKTQVTSFVLPNARADKYNGRVGPSGKVLTGPDLIRRGR